MQRTLFALAATALLAGAANAQGTTKAEDEWYKATGKTCASTDVTSAKTVNISPKLYDSRTMISPDSAKLIALCVVHGQISSGDMNVVDGRTQYNIDVIPDNKKTHSKVVVDAVTGAVLSSKQFGGLRGLSGWVRESFEHKKNTP
jgi:uncharacterized membrane protein YkoI